MLALRLPSRVATTTKTRSRFKAMILEDTQGIAIRRREKKSAEKEHATLYHAARSQDLPL